MVDVGYLLDADDLDDNVDTNEQVVILVEDQQRTKVCNVPISRLTLIDLIKICSY